MNDATSTVAIRVLVVDDHWVVREGLRRYLTDEPGVMVIGEASNGNQAIASARELKPDVILMDILMPQMDGIAATARIKAEMPKVEDMSLSCATQGHSEYEAI